MLFSSLTFFSTLLCTYHFPLYVAFLHCCSALKMLKKVEVIRLQQIEHMISEKSILSRMDHPFIVRLAGTFQDPKYLYMALEYIVGGEVGFLLSSLSELYPLSHHRYLFSHRVFNLHLVSPWISSNQPHLHHLPYSHPHLHYLSQYHHSFSHIFEEQEDLNQQQQNSTQGVLRIVLPLLLLSLIFSSHCTNTTNLLLSSMYL